MEPGTPCPVASGRRVSPDFGVALGGGPVYPVGLGSDGVLQYVLGDERGGFPGPWGGQKVLWVAPPDFGGAVLVRGHRMDGLEEVRFGLGADPLPELRLVAGEGGSSPSGWRNWPGYTRVRAPGRHAYQIDTARESYTIVFRAERAP